MDSELRNMVMAFRVTELQNLLGHFNKNKNGRKNELQARALELVKVNNSVIVAKIRDLYRSIQLSLNQPLPASAVLAHNQQYSNPTSAMAPGRVYSSGGITTGDKVMYQTRYPNTFGQLPGLQVINHHNSRVPICPDVQMKGLPFYDIMAQLIRPTSLLSTTTTGRAHEANFTFFLTPSQAGDISSSKEFNSLNECKVQYGTQVQIRFCALVTGSAQDDLFPPSMQVKVNNRSVPLPHPIPSNRPGVEPKRPSRPLNVTNFVKNSPTVTNNVNVTWASDTSGRDYVISITLVKKLVSQDLLNRLKAKGPRPSDYTKGMVKEMVRRDDADCIASSTFKVSVACPLGKCRMSLPCRASTCKHLQCFDANLYLQMNEKKPVWSCPVCDKYTAFEDLAIDGYFQEVITKMCNNGEPGNEIEVMQDGAWAPLKVKKEQTDEPPAKRMKPSKMEDTICLDDDDIAVISDDDSARKTIPAPVVAEKPKGPAEVIDLTCTSDEENSKDDGSSTSSSSSKADDSEDDVVKPSTKRKKSFVFHESSSSSDESPDAKSVPAPSKTPPATTVLHHRPPPSTTPDCITLDSPSPSPSPERASDTNKNKTNGDKGQARGNTASNKDNAPSQLIINPMGSPFNTPCTLRSTASTSTFSAESLLAGFTSGGPLFGTAPAGSSGSDFTPSNPFASFPTWDNSTAFPSSTDFSSLDYPSMDYFNQGSSSTSSAFGGNTGGRSGNGPGFGGPPRYF